MFSVIMSLEAKICLMVYIVSATRAVDLNTNSTVIETLSVPLSANITTEVGNGSTELLSITQPSQATQQIERTIINDSKTFKKEEFRPSPQLDADIYEYNKFPVVPAMPEAKHFSHLNLGEVKQRGNVAWVPSPATNSRVVFPQPTIATSKDRPYPFLTAKTPDAATNSRTFGFGNEPNFSSISSSGPEGPTKYGGSGVGGSWDKFEIGNKKPTGVHKTYHEHSPSEKPAGGSINPIKKIIGILAAFIPIGLLLSALTPSVIQVVPVNMSQTRSRKESVNLATRLISSLNRLEDSEGCEERILCELLLSAGASKNAEQHVENLLQTFTEQERDAVEKAEELQRVYEGVRKNNCKRLKCHNIKEKRETRD